MNDPISMLTPGPQKLAPLPLVQGQSKPEPKPSAAIALNQVLDPTAEEDLMDEMQLHLEFEQQAARLLELADRIGIQYAPEDPRASHVLKVIDSTGVPFRDAALMVANKAKQATAARRERFNPDTFYKYLAKNERYLARPQS